MRARRSTCASMRTSVWPSLVTRRAGRRGRTPRASAPGRRSRAAPTAACAARAVTRDRISSLVRASWCDSAMRSRVEVQIRTTIDSSDASMSALTGKTPPPSATSDPAQRGRDGGVGDDDGAAANNSAAAITVSDRNGQNARVGAAREVDGDAEATRSPRTCMCATSSSSFACARRLLAPAPEQRAIAEVEADHQADQQRQRRAGAKSRRAVNSSTRSPARRGTGGMIQRSRTNHTCRSHSSSTVIPSAAPGPGLSAPPSSIRSL